MGDPVNFNIVDVDAGFIGGMSEFFCQIKSIRQQHSFRIICRFLKHVRL